MTELLLYGASRTVHLSRVWVPTAFAVTGSDITRVCLTRLGCVFRVFHPLDAFFLPKPLHRISDGNAPGIELSEGFPFHGTSLASRPALPAWCWLKRPAPARRPTVLAHLPGFFLRGSPLLRCRQATPKLDPPLSFSPSRVYSPSSTPRSSRRFLP
jgi:hypothetical protein